MKRGSTGSFGGRQIIDTNLPSHLRSLYDKDELETYQLNRNNNKEETKNVNGGIFHQCNLQPFALPGLVTAHNVSFDSYKSNKQTVKHQRKWD